MPDCSLSIIVPAFNEEQNIEAACREIDEVAQKFLSDYEIIVIDDASRDRTGEIVKRLQLELPRLALIQNETNRGLGYNFRRGLFAAKFPYSIMVPGDNETDTPSLEILFQNVGTKDILVCYTANPGARSIQRQMVSKLFTKSINFLFRLNLSYYNGTSVVRTDLGRFYAPTTSSFAYMAVILIRSIKRGASYQELPVNIRGRELGKSKAFRFKNIVNVLRSVLGLFWTEMVWKSSASRKPDFCRTNQYDGAIR